jgi:hypothetical protein
MLQPSVITPWLVEDDLGRRLAAVELDLERLRRRERVDVMEDGIAIRERDRRPGLDHAHVRHELAVDLLDHVHAAGPRVAGARGGLGIDHGVGDRVAGGVAHLRVDRRAICGAGRDRCGGEEEGGRQSGHRKQALGDCVDGPLGESHDCSVAALASGYGRRGRKRHR